MKFEKFDLESLDKNRLKTAAESIRTIGIEELKALGEELFPWGR